MNTAYRLLGGIFVVLGIVAVVANDWLRAGLYIAMGASFVLGTQRTKRLQIVRGALTLIAIGFAVAWFTTNYSRF